MRLHLISSDNHITIANRNGSIFLSDIKEINIHHSKDLEVWHITTSDNKKTILSEDGMFYFRFSCEHYSFVERLSVEHGLFIAEKHGKSGLFVDKNYYESTCYEISPNIIWIADCVYSYISPLVNNYFYRLGKVNKDCGGGLIFKEFALLLKSENGQSLLYPYADTPHWSLCYDEILIYNQPTEFIAVIKNKKYGLIRRNNGEEVFPPSFSNVDDIPGIESHLHYKKDLYKTKNCVRFVSAVDLYGGYYDCNGVFKNKLRSVEDIHEDNCLYAIKDINGKNSIINKYGFFYNFFDCREYDFVSSMYNGTTYIFRKNNKYGIIDKNQKIVIGAVYNDIEQLALNGHLKMCLDSGCIVMDIGTKRKSMVYEEIEYNNGVYFVRKHNLYGFLNKDLVEVVTTKYEKDPIAHFDLNVFKDYYPYLLCKINGRRVPICPNSKYYGLFETDYEECYCLGDYFGTKYFVAKSKGVYGIAKIEKSGREYTWIYEPCFDEVYFYDTPLYGHPYINFNLKREEYRTLFVGKIKGIYGLYEVNQNKCFLSNFDAIEIHKSHLYKDAPYFVARTKDDISYFDAYGIKISKEETHPMRRGNSREWEQPTYIGYTQSYAQDEMGYSDDDIDTIFDGDPDAYWNID